VVGAHLAGQPLNAQLIARGARLIATPAPQRATGCTPLRLRSRRNRARPRCRWRRGDRDRSLGLPRAEVGGFLALVPPPLCLGSVDLEDGSRVTGFLCEPHALTGARDITAFGGWRAYLRSAAAS